MPIHCEIVSQDRMVFVGDVDIVIIPGAEGEMGILPNHAPTLTVLKYGVITIRSKVGEDYFTVAGGFAEVLPDKITILADAAENVDEIDIQRAENARKKAEELLKVGTGVDPDTYLRVQASLRKSSLRIDAVKRYQKGKNLRSHNG